jgi:hypothetical protein
VELLKQADIWSAVNKACLPPRLPSAGLINVNNGNEARGGKLVARVLYDFLAEDVGELEVKRDKTVFVIRLGALTLSLSYLIF